MNHWIEIVRSRLNAEFGSHAWICVLATVNTQGQPTARCMVCREIDRDGQFWFVSDRRTRKDDHLRAFPDAEICFWLPNEAVQLRVSGRATVMDAQTDQYLRQNWWEKIPQSDHEIFGANPTDADPPMPGTFELISISPVTIELQDLKISAHQKQVWKTSSDGQLAEIM